jgi:mannose-6-phosphate isomerase-like protein (cupin superfamily)
VGARPIRQARAHPAGRPIPRAHAGPRPKRFYVSSGHGDSSLLDAAPGRGPSLHGHDYAEVFIVLEGQATFRGPDGVRKVSEGHVVIAPAGEPHGFVNSGDGRLRQVNIHASPRFVTEWLEQEAYG